MKSSLSLAAQFEKSETDYRITLKSLSQAADALGCDLVYALVPKQGTLHDLAQHRATEAATADVLAVEHTMALENQAVGGVKEKIREEAHRILNRK
jgi:enoyl-CoA hydratase/carnithine racemase